MAAELTAFTFDQTHEKIGLRLTCKEGELPRIHKVIPESHAAKMGVVDGSFVVKIKYKTKDKKTVEVDMVGLPSDMMEQKIVAGMQERPITFYLRKPAAASASNPAKGGAPVERKDSGVSMSDLNRKLIELEERLKSEATARAATERENSAIKRDLEQARSRPTTPRADVEEGMAARLLPASLPSSSAVERPTPVSLGQGSGSPESMIAGAFRGAFDPDYVPGLNWIKMGPGRPEHVLLKLKKLNGGSELFEPQQLFNPRLAFNLKYRDAFAEEDLRDIFADDNSFSASMLRPGHFIEVPVRIGLTWISLPEPPLSGTELKPLPVTASPGRGTPNHAKLQDMLERKQQQQHQRENVQTIEFSRTADWLQAIKERNPSRPESASKRDTLFVKPVASPRLASYLREHYAPGKVYGFLPHADDKSPLPCYDEFNASPTIEFKGKPNDKQYYIPVDGTSKGVTYFAGTKYFAPVALDDPEHGVLWKDGTLRLWPVGTPWQDGELVERRGVELSDLSQALQLKLDCDLHDGHRGLQFTADEMKVIFLSCLDGSSLKNNCYYVKLGETALGTARYFQLHSMSAGHTTWLSLGSSEPHLDQHLDQHSAKGAGKAAVALEIMNPEFAKLVSARVQSKSYPKVDFSQSEFDAFGMTRLPHDSFIVSEGSYWRPADIAVKYFRPAGEDEMHLVDPFFREYADCD